MFAQQIQIASSDLRGSYHVKTQRLTVVYRPRGFPIG